MKVQLPTYIENETEISPFEMKFEDGEHLRISLIYHSIQYGNGNHDIIN